MLRLKDYLPKSLFGRSLLIIVLPIALMQVAVAWAFFDAHWETVTSRLSETVAGDIAVIVETYRADATPEEREALRRLEDTLGISAVLEPQAKLPTTIRSSFFRVLDRTIRRALSEKLDAPFWFDTTRYPAYVDVRVQVDGGVLRLIVPRDRVFATTGHIFILWIVGATTLLTAVSVIYIRNQARPIERLAAAADAFGRGADAPDFKPSGASEVRQAAQAFLKMRDRIARHIEQRTTILAGVSHDLRTPITRLRLHLAMLPESADVDAMRRDLADMEAILEEYLAFARGMAGEDPEPVDLGELARDAVRDAGHARDPAAADSGDPGDGAGDAGVRIEIETGGDLVALVRAAAMKRALTNLIANAAAHGAHVAVAARRLDDAIVIDIDDDGPGIPEDLREEAFKPFNRIDPARNRNTNGVGLGLAIARDVARGHGGEIRLSESPLGGLRATVRVPV